MNHHSAALSNKLDVTGNNYVSNTTDASSSTAAGTIIIRSGLAAEKISMKLTLQLEALAITGVTTLSNTTDATSSTAVGTIILVATGRKNKHGK